MDLLQELDRAETCIAAARAALRDEHEGNLRESLTVLADVSHGMHHTIRHW